MSKKEVKEDLVEKEVVKEEVETTTEPVEEKVEVEETTEPVEEKVEVEETTETVEETSEETVEEEKEEVKADIESEVFSAVEEKEETTEPEKKEETKDTEIKETEKDIKIKKEIKSENRTLIILALVALFLVVGLVILFVTTKPKNNPNETEGEIYTELSTDENRKVLETALDNLKSEEKYVITTYLTMGSDGSSYIDIVEPNGSYTMYNMEDDSKAFQELVAESETGIAEGYIMNDYLDKDGNLYFLSDSYDEEGNSVLEAYKTPDEYGKLTKERTTMYAGWVVPNLTDIEFKETVDTDFGVGTVNMDVYEGVLSSDIVKKILGHGSSTLYETVSNSTESEGMKKLMGWLKEDSDFSLYFSDANVILGIVDDKLVYMNLEVGGLGTRMYLTKCVLLGDIVDDYIIEEYPVTENALSYENIYSDIGEMALDYDNLEDLYDALYSGTVTDDNLNAYMSQMYENYEYYMTDDANTYVFDGNVWYDMNGNVVNITENEDGTFTTEDGKVLNKLDLDSSDNSLEVNGTEETSLEDTEVTVDENAVSDTEEIKVE